jgi:hypothetical protein
MEDEVVPLDYHIYFIKTRSCKNCHQPLRHPLHAFNHWNKYHNKRPIVRSEKPTYYVWYENEWVQVNMETCMAAMLEKRAYVITKPRNLESKSRGN